MRLKVIALVAFLFVVAVSKAQYNGGYGTAAQVGIVLKDAPKPSSPTSTYHNSRFGFYYTYPRFMVPQGGGANGDGCRFSSADGRVYAEAWAMLNALDYTTNSLLQSMKESLISDGCRITYSFAKNGTVVLSGYTRAGKIFYDKYVLCKLHSSTYGYVDVIACAKVEYYQNDKYRGEEVIKHFSGFPYE